MPVFSLDNNVVLFPPPEMADSSGLLAIGGDLSFDWLIEAYTVGVFPWFNESEPIMWWSPNPRSVVKPGEVKLSKSMKSIFNQNIFELRIDTVFSEVIDSCQKKIRVGQDGTWITQKMKEGYINLHNLGYAHSFETWKNDKLVGGLYGVSLGKLFFGESMFSNISNASKFSFISLSTILKKNDFVLIDCQVPNSHLKSMGCVDMSRNKYLQILEKNRSFKSILGNWGEGLMKI